MASPAAILNILVTANSKGAIASLKAVDLQAGKTATKANGMGKAINAAGKAAALGTAAIAVGAVKMATDFDKSMRNVNSIAQLPERALKDLEKNVLALAGKTAQAPRTLADGLYDLVSSGFDAKDSMLVLASSAKAATAGLTTTEVSTKAVAAVLNAYRLPAKAAAKVSDQLFQTVNLGVVSFEELASTIGDVLPFASSLGVGLDQVGASVATLTKAGISPAETMTRLKAVMVSLLKPSEDLSKAIKATGFESGEALIRQRGFQGALDALVKTTDGSKGAVAALFPNIRALGGALALTGKNSRGANADLKAFGDTSGATNKALSQQSQSLAFQWQKLKAQVTALLIELGTKLLPVLAGATKFFSENKSALYALAGALAVATAGWIALKIAMLANPYVAAAAAIVALAVLIITNWDKIKAKTKEVWDWIKSHLSIVLPAILSVIAGPFGAIVGLVIANWGKITRATSDAWNSVKSTVSSTVGSIGRLISSGVGAARSAAISVGRAALNGIKSGLSGLAGFFGGLAHTIANAVRGTLGDITNFFVNIGKAIITAIANGIKAAPGVIGSALKSVMPSPGGGVPFIPGIAGGGRIRGGVRGRDSVPALLAPGEFVVTGGGEKILERMTGVPGVLDWLGGSQPRHFAAGGRAGVAASAAKAAGFKGSALATMVAIAGAESGFNPRAQNLKYPDHSIGLWQINQLAHKGRFGTDAQLMNPGRNAKAAYALYKQSGFVPWSTYTSGAYKSYLKEAQAAIGASGKGKGAAGTKAKTKTTKLARLEEAVALAALSGGQGDDLKAATALVSYWSDRLKGARTTSQRTAAATSLRSARDSRASIFAAMDQAKADASVSARSDSGPVDTSAQDALDANTAATAEHTSALRDLQSAIDAQRQFAQSALTTQNAQAWKALADILSGQIGGYGGLGSRTLTAGAGVVTRY